MKQFYLIVLMSIAALGMSLVYGADVVPHQESSLLLVDLPAIPFDAALFCKSFAIGLCFPGICAVETIVPELFGHSILREYYTQKYNPLAYVQEKFIYAPITRLSALSAEDKNTCCEHYVTARRFLTARNIEASKESIKEFNGIMERAKCKFDIVATHNSDVRLRSQYVYKSVGLCIGSMISASLLIVLAVHKDAIVETATEMTAEMSKKQSCAWVCKDLD